MVEPELQFQWSYFVISLHTTYSLCKHVLSPKVIKRHKTWGGIGKQNRKKSKNLTMVVNQTAKK